MRLSLLLVCTNLLALLGGACVASALESNDGDPSKLTSVQLVARLVQEMPAADAASAESNIFHHYDTTVEEILSRKDSTVIPLLIALSNDSSVVVSRQGGLMNRCGYDSPVLLKYKVRYVLYRLLPEEYHPGILPSDYDQDIDIPTALEVFADRRTEIEHAIQGLGSEATPDPKNS